MPVLSDLRIAIDVPYDPRSDGCSVVYRSVMVAMVIGDEMLDRLKHDKVEEETPRCDSK